MDLPALAFNHRRTLHYPIIFSISSLISGAVVILAPSLVSVAVFYFFLSAAVHSLIDVFEEDSRHVHGYPRTIEVFTLIL